MLPALQNKILVRTQVDTDQALVYLGYSGQTIDKELKMRLEGVARRCEGELVAHAAWRVFKIESGGVETRAATDAQGAEEEDSASAPISCNTAASDAATPAIRLQDCALTLPGTSMQSYLRGAESVLLFACTLGNKADRTIAELQATAPLDALLYAQCANTLIESAAQSVQEQASSLALQDGLFARMRFSPGYGDLPLSVQDGLLDVIGADRMLGITTTPSHFMMPSKSISGVIGLFRRQADARDYALCDTCNTKDYCTYREKGSVCYA